MEDRPVITKLSFTSPWFNVDFSTYADEPVAQGLIKFGQVFDGILSAIETIAGEKSCGNIDLLENVGALLIKTQSAYRLTHSLLNSTSEEDALSALEDIDGQVAVMAPALRIAVVRAHIIHLETHVAESPPWRWIKLRVIKRQQERYAEELVRLQS